MSYVFALYGTGPKIINYSEPTLSLIRVSCRRILRGCCLENMLIISSILRSPLVDCDAMRHTLVENKYLLYLLASKDRRRKHNDKYDRDNTSPSFFQVDCPIVYSSTRASNCRFTTHYMNRNILQTDSDGETLKRSPGFSI